MSKADRERGFDLREIVRGLRSSHGSPLVARKLFKLVHGGCEETREREREREMGNYYAHCFGEICRPAM